MHQHKAGRVPAAVQFARHKGCVNQRNTMKLVLERPCIGISAAIGPVAPDN